MQGLWGRLHPQPSSSTANTCISRTTAVSSLHKPCSAWCIVQKLMFLRSVHCTQHNSCYSATCQVTDEQLQPLRSDQQHLPGGEVGAQNPMQHEAQASGSERLKCKCL
jgi:hypothetical protein